MQLEDLILISVDDHVVEPPSLGDFFRENLPAKFKDRAPKVVRKRDLEVPGAGFVEFELIRLHSAPLRLHVAHRVDSHDALSADGARRLEPAGAHVDGARGGEDRRRYQQR